jgi:hypothetical protein
VILQIDTERPGDGPWSLNPSTGEVVWSPGHQTVSMRVPVYAAIGDGDKAIVATLNAVWRATVGK